MAIDWAASGTWMQAWAGFAQAAAVAYAAHKAANVFQSWRRQKIEERRIDHAEIVLSLAYRLRSAFDSIRNPMALFHELDAAEKSLIEQDSAFAHKPEHEKSRLRQGQAILDRIHYFKADWGKLSETIPKAEALFGSDVSQALDTFWRQRHSISVYAEAYARGTGNDSDFRKKVESIIWKHGGEDDPVEQELSKAFKCLENILLPIIRADK